MKTLTAPLLRELIDKITVYEIEGAGKNRSQRIVIHYKFVGIIEIPECGGYYKANTRKGVAVKYIISPHKTKEQVEFLPARALLGLYII